MSASDPSTAGRDSFEVSIKGVRVDPGEKV